MTGLSLLPAGQEEGYGGQTQKFKGVAMIRGPRWAHLPIVTIGLLGVQIFWSVEMSYASPYLLSLGLSKSSMAGVFVAGPLSGLIMQPLIGTLADNSTSRFGRRRPYMLLGTFMCILSMLLLGFTRPVASLFTALHSTSNDTLTISLAVLSIFLLDFSINAIHAVDRALIVDTLPSSLQASGNAWAATMIGVGSVVGFFIGNINLPRILPFLGNTQLQVLSVAASILLLIGHLVMVMLVKEPVLCSKSQGKSFLQEVVDLWNNIRILPRLIRQICIIQFFAAMSWFPCIFYITLYIGDVYKRNSPVPTTDEEQLLLDAEAPRFASHALFLAAVLALFTNITLPAFISRTTLSKHTVPRNEESWWVRMCRPPKYLQIDLPTIWAISHLVFAACMFATFFTNSIFGSTIIITVTGFSGAIGQWAPFSMLGEAILTERIPQSDSMAIRLVDTLSPRPAEDPEREFLVSGVDSDEEDDNEEAKPLKKNGLLTHSGARVSIIDLSEVDEYDDRYEVLDRGSSGRRGPDAGTLSSKAGIILGIHNIFIVIPQFLVTGLAALLFSITDPAEPGHQSPPAEVGGGSQSNSVVYMFCFGGVASLLAFVLTWRLARELLHR